MFPNIDFLVMWNQNTPVKINGFTERNKAICKLLQFYDNVA